MTTRKPRSFRPTLECLESRTVLSTVLPKPPTTTAIVHQVSTRVNYSYSWIVTPGAVLTGTNSTTHNKRSTGSVAFAWVRQTNASLIQGGSAATIPFGYVLTSSSAPGNHPDVYNRSFTIRLGIRDASSGVTGYLYFKGTLTGTLTASSSHLTVKFAAPTQRITLGSHI